MKHKIKIITMMVALLITPLLSLIQPKEALAAQGCSLNSFYGTVIVNGLPTDDVTVTLTDLTNGAPALSTLTAGGGIYLIESANLATCASVGDHIQITASLNGSSVDAFVNYASQAITNVDLALSSQVLTSILLIPDVLGTMIEGDTLQLSAVGLDQNGLDVNPQPILSWFSSMPSVATVDQSGFLTAVSPGTSIISVSNGSIITSASLTVSVPVVVPVLTSITVAPTTSSILTGATQQFTATALDQNGVAMNPQPT
ncbi:MAG: hypothetical protein WAV48_05965, partial [Candidatus Magasanikiibacteriota bacterium]